MEFTKFCHGIDFDLVPVGIVRSIFSEKALCLLNDVTISSQYIGNKLMKFDNILHLSDCIIPSTFSEVNNKLLLPLISELFLLSQMNTYTFEPRHEKTNVLYMRKQRRRSASQ